MINPDKLDELRWDCERVLTSQCYAAEKLAEKNGEDHKCTCPDPYEWTEEQCLEFLGGE